MKQAAIPYGIVGQKPPLDADLAFFTDRLQRTSLSQSARIYPFGEAGQDSNWRKRRQARGPAPTSDGPSFPGRGVIHHAHHDSHA